MNQKKKKAMMLLLSCMIVTLLGGCHTVNEEKNGSEGEEVSEELVPAWKEYAGEPITLDWYINYSWYATPWGENAVSKKITEETGVDINFIVPMGNEGEKLKSMMSSDTLPDIITVGWWEDSIQTMVNNDMVWALNELADEYDPYFFEVTDEVRRNWYTEEDGNLYCYPNSSYTINDYKDKGSFGSNQAFLVRKDIYEAIGSPDMTTPEGFKEAVKKAQKMFPTVDGEPLIPIGCDEFTVHGNNSFDNYLMSFLAVPYEKNGEYYDRYADEDYISWLKVFRELNEEGYLAKDIFIDKRGQLEEKIAQGRYFCMLYQRTDIAEQQTMLYANNPERVYMAVDGPRNSKGDDPTLPGTGINGWTVTMISKNCENPERAIAFMSYLISEHGQKVIFLGVEGITYDMVDGVPTMKPEVLEVLNTDRVTYDKLYGANDAYWMLQDNAMQSKWAIEPIPPLLQLQEYTEKYTVYTGQYDVAFSHNTELATAYSKVRKEWGDVLPKLLLAESEEEFDKVFEEYLIYRDKVGYDKILEDSTRQMKENKIKLGIE